MRNFVLYCGLSLGLPLVPLCGGTVTFLADTPEVDGKVTIGPSSIHVEGSSPTDINLSDVLFADFSDTPFHLEYFSTTGLKGTTLPDGWKGQDIGSVDAPGSGAVADGVFTLNGGSGGTMGGKEDKVFFLGRQWTGNGQWTIHLKETDGQDQTSGGFTVRDNLNTGSPMMSIAMTNLYPAEGWSYFRDTPDASPDIQHYGVVPPCWLRITRSGQNFLTFASSDAKDWTLLQNRASKIADMAWVGLILNSNRAKFSGKAVFDQATFTPAPSNARVVAPGVLLKSGTFLSGYFDPIDFSPDTADPIGHFNRSGKRIDVPASKTAFAIIQPMLRTDLANLGDKAGLIMKNGDFMDGALETINAREVRVSSVLLGTTTYGLTDARACVLNRLDPQPAEYEIRLKDGSVIRADGFSVNDGQLSIEDVSGVSVIATPDEIVQFRAGSAHVQTMLDLPWTLPATAAAAKTTPDQPPPVQCWATDNQQQVMMTDPGTQVDFPLTGKFRSMALSIALSSDSPHGAQATVRILADGQEIGRTPAFKAGDPPRFVQVTLNSPKVISLAADALFAGTKILYIDPVAIRDTTTQP